MASKREARRQGYEYGFGIAAENFGELFEEYGKAILIGQESDFLSFFVGKVSEMESEHFRQFTPFEFIAQDFNSSRDPDAVWEAYEEGVAQGALAAAKVGLQGCDRVYQLP